jgi:hypothetical protein
VSHRCPSEEVGICPLRAGIDGGEVKGRKDVASALSPSIGEDVTPRPAALIEALRSLGYSVETAIADLLDNSISANARNIEVGFTWNGQDSCISVIDDGNGMTLKALVEAMRPGTLGPSFERAEGDLGRFGLGLKTASLSQCRCFTVFTKAKGQPAVARKWDLDQVEAGGWRLSTTVSTLASEVSSPLKKMECGTCVVWENLDRFLGAPGSDEHRAHRSFLEAADRVKHHLAIVFGDFLEGSGAVCIRVGRDVLRKWDPFLRGHAATQILPAQTLWLSDRSVEVQPFVVPHHSKLGKEEFAAAGGPLGWNAHQGFYVYRNRRLLVMGGWLGLGLAREEHLKLARIRIDLGSDSDFEWNLDVRKSRASPPPELRDDLRRIARLTRERACEVYRHRGRKVVLTPAENGVPASVWEGKLMRGKMIFWVNREHPVVKAVCRETGNHESVEALLRLVEESVPRASIFINHAEAPEDQPRPFEGARDADVRAMIEELYRSLVKAGRSHRQAIATLSALEALKERPQLLALIADEPPEDAVDDE